MCSRSPRHAATGEADTTTDGTARAAVPPTALLAEQASGPVPTPASSTPAAPPAATPAPEATPAASGALAAPPQVIKLSVTSGQASKIDTTSDAAIAARTARFGSSTPASAQPPDVVEAVAPAPASSGAQAGGGERGGGDLRRKLAGKGGKKGAKPADWRKRIRPADEEGGEAPSSPRPGRSLGSGGGAGRSRGGGGAVAPVDLRSKLVKR